VPFVSYNGVGPVKLVEHWKSFCCRRRHSARIVVGCLAGVEVFYRYCVEISWGLLLVTGFCVIVGRYGYLHPWMSG